MSEGLPLEDRLAGVLPKDWKARIYHVSTPPTASSPILAAPPNQKDQTTSRASHFLAVASAVNDGRTEGSAVLIYAIEVLIFATATLTTVFVSKADSSGFRPKLNSPKTSGSIAQSVTQAFLDHLLEPLLDKSKVVISLFARSQHQYLFPGSIENADKHVLSDRQLIKWWCKILDRVWRPYDNSTAPSGLRRRVTAYVIVPGCDKAETRFFLPVSTRSDPPEDPKWLNSYPESFIAGDQGLPPRCVIPRFPDDPKSRFLDDLDGDCIGPEGQWRGVTSLSQFWEMMAYRQECHAGNLVGFVWVTFQTEGPPRVQNDAVVPQAPPEAHNPSDPEPSAPTLPHQLTSVPLQEHELNSTHPLTPQTSTAAPKGEAILTAESYDTAMDFLLQLDFTGIDAATESTQKWTERIMELAPASDFGATVVGRQVSVETTAQPALVSAPEANLLTGVRKKRKADLDPSTATTTVPASGQQQPNILSSGLVRKKPKQETSS